jgi:TonB family protein
MLRTSFLVVSLLAASAQSFEPAKFMSGGIEGIPYRSFAAGMVVLEVSVNAQGRVTGARTLEAVEPFTDVMTSSVRGWSFEPARENRVRTESRVLVMGFFRPAMLLPPAPDGFREPDAEPSEDVPFPLSIDVPPYPPNAIGSHYVLVEIEVGEGGSVTSAQVRSPTSGFDSAAVDAARGWKFQPASRDGRPAPTLAYLIVAFRQPA